MTVEAPQALRGMVGGGFGSWLKRIDLFEFRGFFVEGVLEAAMTKLGEFQFVGGVDLVFF